LLGAIDEEQAAYALSQGRVIFTQDRDFLRINAAGVPHAGIAYCEKDTRSIGEIVNSLMLIWELYEPDEMANRVEYIRVHLGGIDRRQAAAGTTGRSPLFLAPLPTELRRRAPGVFGANRLQSNHLG
jgi:hypothetical protein